MDTLPNTSPRRKPGRRSGNQGLLYQEVAEALRERLRDGSYAVGLRLPSNEELAQQLNVNRLTIRRAISDLISEGLLIAQPSRGTFVADPSVAKPIILEPAAPEPNADSARPTGDDVPLRLAAVVSRVFFPAFPGAYHLEFLNAIRSELFEIACGLTMPPNATAADPFAEWDADGLILLGPFATEDLRRAAAGDKPTVLLDADPGDAPLDAVMVDNAAVGRLAAGHLRERGHVGAAIVAGGMEQPAMRERLAGFRTAWAADGGDPSAVRVLDGAFQETVAFSRVDEALATSPEATGIFCLNDDMAAGALRAVNEQGRTDVGVMGCDDVAFAAMLHPALTTIRIPREAMARLAVRCLAGWRAARRERMPPVRHMVTPSLVVRASTDRR